MNDILKKIYNSPSIVLAAILLFGLSLRLISISVQPFWGDELLGLGIIKTYETIPSLINYLRWAEVHPPVFYIFYHFWTTWFGFSEVALRVPTVLSGTLTIWLSYIVSFQFFKNRKIAYLSAFFVAILPILIYFSQVVRPYIFLTNISLVAIWLYWERWKKNNKSFSLFFVITSLVGLYLHYSFGIFLLSILIYWLGEIIIVNRSSAFQEFIEWLLVVLLISLGFYPWLDVFLYKYVLSDWSLYGLQRNPIPFTRSPHFLAELFSTLVWTTTDKSAHVFELFAILLFKFTFIFTFFYSILQKPYDWQQSLSKDSQKLIFLVTTMALSIVAYIFLPVSTSYTPLIEQHILYLAPIVAIGLAYIISKLPMRSLWLVVTLFIISLFSFTALVVQDDSVWNSSYRVKPVADFINELARPGDIVITTYPFFRTDLNYYLRDDLETISFFPINFNGNDMFASRLSLGIFENETHFRLSVPSSTEAYARFEQITKNDDVKRIWFAYFLWPDYASNWFKSNDWSAQIRSTGKFRELMPVDLYVRNNVQE